jgi:hypothetical protein
MTVRLDKIIFSSTQTTLGLISWQLIKRSAANTGGTATTLTAVPLDSADPAASGVAKNYTANAAGLGTAVGTIAKVDLLSAALTSAICPVFIWDFTGEDEKLILRGIAETAALSFGGAALPAGMVVSVTLLWTEL